METAALGLAGETDAGLLFLIGEADASSAADEALAREAQRVFFNRHYGYVLAILKRFAENVGTVIIDPDEFTVATLAKAFVSAKTFRDKSEGDPARSAAQVRAWLGRIASNLAKDELDRVSRLDADLHVVILDDEHDIPEEPAEIDGGAPTNRRALAALRTILDALKPEERDILMTYGTYGIPTQNGRELPADVREALERRTGYERCSIRQKWHRLSQRLKRELESFLTKNQ